MRLRPARSVAEPVDVIEGDGVADEDARRDHASEAFCALVVDGSIVRIDGRIEIDLRL